MWVRNPRVRKIVQPRKSQNSTTTNKAHQLQQQWNFEVFWLPYSGYHVPYASFLYCKLSSLTLTMKRQSEVQMCTCSYALTFTAMGCVLLIISKRSSNSVPWVQSQKSKENTQAWCPGAGSMHLTAGCTVSPEAKRHPSIVPKADHTQQTHDAWPSPAQHRWRNCVCVHEQKTVSDGVKWVGNFTLNTRYMVRYTAVWKATVHFF